MLIAQEAWTIVTSGGVLFGRIRIGRLIELLSEGDSTTWIILGVVVVGVIAFYVIKAMMNKGG